MNASNPTSKSFILMSYMFVFVQQGGLSGGVEEGL